MPRAVPDPGVLVSAEIAPRGAPNQLLRAAADARYQLVVSRKLLKELEEVLLRPKFRRYLSEDEVHEFVRGVSDVAELASDPLFEPGLTPDPDDDYLVALARVAEADVLVSGDPDLTELQDADPPVMTPRTAYSSGRVRSTTTGPWSLNCRTSFVSKTKHPLTYSNVSASTRMWSSICLF